MQGSATFDADGVAYAVASGAVVVVAAAPLKLAQTVPGRTLLGALALAHDGWVRADVVATP